MIQLIVFIIFINSALPTISTTMSANLPTYNESSLESSHSSDIIVNETDTHPMKQSLNYPIK